MAREDLIEMEGTVTEVLPGTKFMVEVPRNNANAIKVKCTLTGRLRQNYIRILNGDLVKLRVSPYDLTNGVIIWRSKS